MTTLTITIDNPGGEWLKYKQQECFSAGTNQFGAPKRFGSVTGRFSRAALLPVSIVVRIKGLSGEQSNVRNEDLNWLVQEMGDNNRLPLHNGKQYAPYIEVDYTGRPWVSEGNHRIMAANRLGWKYIPVDVRYFSGGEIDQYESILSPDTVISYDNRALAAGYEPINQFKGLL